MAKALDMSLSSYKRLANGDTGKVDVYTVYKLSQLTGKMFYELCGESSDLFQTYDRMRQSFAYTVTFSESLVQFDLILPEIGNGSIGFPRGLYHYDHSKWKHARWNGV